MYNREEREIMEENIESIIVLRDSRIDLKSKFNLRNPDLWPYVRKYIYKEMQSIMISSYFEEDSGNVSLKIDAETPVENLILYSFLKIAFPRPSRRNPYLRHIKDKYLRDRIKKLVLISEEETMSELMTFRDFKDSKEFFRKCLIDKWRSDDKDEDMGDLRISSECSYWMRVKYRVRIDELNMDESPLELNEVQMRLILIRHIPQSKWSSLQTVTKKTGGSMKLIYICNPREVLNLIAAESFQNRSLKYFMTIMGLVCKVFTDNPLFETYSILSSTKKPEWLDGEKAVSTFERLQSWWSIKLTRKFTVLTCDLCKGDEKPMIQFYSCELAKRSCHYHWRCFLRFWSRKTDNVYCPNCFTGIDKLSIKDQLIDEKSDDIYTNAYNRCLIEFREIFNVMDF